MRIRATSIHAAILPGLLGSMLYFGPLAGESAAAPYPPSTVVTGITYDWSTALRRAGGSDNWPVTWGDDDHQYASWGDGNGFNGTRVSLGVARVEGPWNNYQGYDVWGGQGAEHRAQFEGKSYGIICIDGVLYMWVSPGSNDESYQEARMCVSTDHAATWTRASWAFVRADNIVIPTILNYGKDYAGARDNYVYHYFIELKRSSGLGIQRPGQIQLARVPKDRMMDRAGYEFFAGFDGSQNPTWSSDVRNRIPVFEDAANGVGWNLSVSYNEALRRYFLITEHSSSANGHIGIFDAPEPWGPWTTVNYASSFGGGATFFWNFSNKWMSADGRDFTMVYTGVGDQDAWHSVRGQFTVAPSGDTAPPSVPTGLAVTDVTASTIDLSWNASTDGEGSTPITYQIENVTTGALSGWQTGRTHTATGLAPETWYTFRARARDSQGNTSAFGDTTGAATTVALPDAPPNDPTNVVATTEGQGSIRITWTHNGDPDGDPVQYFVREVSDHGIQSGWLSSGTHTWTATGLSPGTTYRFEVQGRDDASPPAFSAWVQSNPATTDPLANDPPRDPTNVVATALASNAVRITWTHNGDPDGDPVQYFVREVSNHAIQSGWLSSGIHAWTASGLSPNTTYQFEVQGRDDFNPSGLTSWIASNPVTTPPDQSNDPPNPPANVTATVLGTSSIRIDWVDAGDPEGDPVEFYVREVSDYGIASGWLAAGTITWTATGLDPATAYRFEVQGRDDAVPPATSLWTISNVATTDPLSNQPPNRPTNVLATVLGSDAVTITWTDNGDPDGDPVSYYVEEVYDTGINSGWLSPGVTTWTATNLAPGTTYKFQVRGRDDATPPAYSAWVRANTVTTDGLPTSPPRDPSNVTAATQGPTSIAISWTNNGHPDGRPIEFYVEEAADATINSGWLAVGVTSWVASGLSPETTYTFLVRGRDDQDPRQYSAWVSSNPATTDPDPNDPPNDPTNVVAAVQGTSSVRITWAAAGDPDGNPVQYFVREVSNHAIQSGWLASGTAAWTATGLDPATSYQFEVQGRDNQSPPAFSGWVASNTVTTDELLNSPPNRPTAVVATPLGPDTVEITWVAQGDPDGDPVEYYVEEVYDIGMNSGWLASGTTSWTATGLASGTTYKFQVRGRDDHEPPAYSPWVRANGTQTFGEPANPPRDPSNVVASAQGPTSIRITWMDNGHPDGRPVTFFVEEASNPGINSGWLSSGVTEWIATGLEPTTTYTFTVRGRDDQEPPQYSSWVSSNPATTTEPANQAPNDPSNVTATLQGGVTVRVSWTHNGDPDGDAVEYFVREVHDPTINSGWLSPGVTAWTASTLPPETTLQFEVQGRDDAVPRHYTAWISSNSVTTADVPNEPPYDPTDVTAEALGSTSIEITWIEHGDPNGNPVQFYVRDVANHSRNSGWLSAGVTTWTAMGLQPGTSYRFEVQGHDDQEPPLSTPWVQSNLVATPISTNEAPTNPADVVATALGTSLVRISWTGDDPDGDDLVFFVREIADTTISSGWLPNGVTSWDATGLATDTSYRFEVQSRDDGDPPLQSGWSASNPVRTLGDSEQPLAPPPAAPDVTFGGDAVVIAWEASTDPRVIGYNVYRQREGGSTELLTVSPIATTAYEDGAYTEGAAYYYWVTAVDAASQESVPTTDVWVRATPGVPRAAFVDKIFPSPVHDQATFRLGIPETGPGHAGGVAVTIDLYDVAGKRIGRVLQQALAPGMREVTWRMADSGLRLSPGCYLAVVHAAGRELVERIAVAHE